MSSTYSSPAELTQDDLEALYVGSVERRVEVVGCDRVRLGGRNRLGFLRDHQGGRVERRLHSSARRVGARVIDRCTGHADHGNKAERKDRSYAAALVGEKS